jgi:gas vesicle protein
MTMTIQFDTLRYVEKLREAGMSEAHAKASAEALSTALEQSTSTFLATKEDIGELKETINELRLSTKEAISALKSEVRADFVQVKSDLKVMQWMTGTMVVGVVSLVAKSFF